MYREITECRISGSRNLIPILDLGIQHLTGVFPTDPAQPVTAGPLELVFCPDSGLVQLRHSYDLDEMYGMNYGYRSGLNRAMVRHLGEKARRLAARADIGPGDVVLDIGSNDGTTLAAYPDRGQRLIGIDPTGSKFASFYPAHVELVPEFFSAAAYRDRIGDAPARIVTSISMFYDLEDPLDFMRNVAAILAEDGIWHMEQSYLPSMLARNSYDTVCHEHLEYYSLGPILWMAGQCGLRILDVELNDVNGGSFALTLAHESSPQRPDERAIDTMLATEQALALDTTAPYDTFRERVQQHREDLVALVRRLRDEGRTILGYGASTKGNVLLQYCGFTPADIPFIAEVNPDKFGCYTPGTGIPIISESEARRMQPDCLLVLPWHFRREFLERERAFLEGGGSLLFPLPAIEIVGERALAV